MASNYINNLSNTYQQSPSLQNQFATEQDYLDLFDNNKTTPAMAQAYVPTNDTTGIKSIVNTATPIINQGGGDGPPGAPPGATDPGITSDDYGLGVDDQTGMGYELTDQDRSDISGQKTKNTAKGLMAALSFAFNPIGFFIGRYAKDRYKEYKEKKAKDLQNEIDAANKAAAQQAAFDRAMANPKDFYASLNDGAGASVSDQSRDQAGDGNQSGASPFAYGGRVRGGGGPTESYFKGGIVSLRGR